MLSINITTWLTINCAQKVHTQRPKGNQSFCSLTLKILKLDFYHLKSKKGKWIVMTLKFI